MSDLLLEQMSFCGEGRLDSLPTAHLPRPHRVLGNLSALGHVELTSISTWRVAPPVLACLPLQENCEPCAVLCGARTPELLRRVESACQVTGAQLSSNQMASWPSLIRISASSNAVPADVAAHTGILFQNDAAYTMLACIPSIRHWPRQPCQMAGGKVETVKRFSGSSAKWVPSSLSEAVTASKGFFRIKRDWDWVSIFKSSQAECAYIDDRAGRMLEHLAKRLNR